MKKIRHHAAVTLIQPVDYTGDLIFGIYGNGYPVNVFVGHYVPIGGTANGHISPLDTVTTELHEELQDEYFSEESPGTLFNLKDKRAYAQKNSKIEGDAVPLNIRIQFRDAIIEALNPLNDYLVNIDGRVLKSKERNFEFIYSFFGAEVDNALFYTVANQLQRGRELRNEGLTKVISESELANGRFRGAWGAAAIVGDILKINVPEYGWIHIESLGDIRGSYRNYKKDFSYARDPEIKAI